MKAIILARVSTEEQITEGQSIPAQLARAQEYAKRKGLQILSEHQFDESSIKDKREKFEKVIEEVKSSKECVALIVETIDRLQRSFKESVLFDDFRKQGKVELHFIRENLIITKDSNSSEIQRWDLGVFVAKSFVLQISDNVKRTNAYKLANGQCIGKAPTGYKNENKNVVIDPIRAPFVVKMFEMYTTGNYSVRIIQNEMERLGLTSNTKNPKPLSTSQIYHTLKDPFYFGTMRVKGKLYPHNHARLISKALFDQCQVVMRGYHKKPFKYAGKPYIFRGTMKCADCGCTITPETAKGHVYYHCTNSKRFHTGKLPFVREEDLLKPICATLDRLKLSDDKIQDITNDLKRMHESKNDFYENAKTALLQEHGELERRVNRLFDMQLEGSQSITKDMFADKMKELKEKQAEVRAKLAEYDTADEKFYITANTVLNLAKMASEIFECSEPEEKRRLLNFLLQNPTLNGKKIDYTLKEPFDVIEKYAKCSTVLPG